MDDAPAPVEQPATTPETSTGNADTEAPAAPAAPAENN